jgi:tetratricopeptide (TPR) repeat protein
MKKILPILWILILIGAGFITYTLVIKEGAPDNPATQDPTSEDPTQEETAPPPKRTSETYSSLVTKGDELFEDELYEKALRKYQGALVSHPTSLEALYKIGQTYLKNNDPVRARGFFEKVRDNTNSVEINVLIGRTYLNEREIETAKEHFSKLSNKEPEVMFYRGILAILYKNNETGKSIFEDLAPKNKKAQLFVDAFNYFEANRDGKQPHIDTLLAKAMIDSEEYAASIPLLFTAINSQNDYRDAWTLLGYSYLKIGQNQDAIDALLQAKTLDPERPEVLFFLGMAYAIEDRFEDSIYYLEKAKKAGFQPQIQLEQKLADIYIIQEEYDKAVKTLDKVTKLNPSDLSIFEKAVQISIEKLEEPKKALYFAKKAVENHPEEALSYDLRGWALITQGEYDDAKADLVKALEMDPDLPQTYKHIGLLFAKQGQPDIAQKYYLKADITSPQSP